MVFVWTEKYHETIDFDRLDTGNGGLRRDN